MLEHRKDLEYRRPRSHLLRHAVEKHPHVDPSELDFRVKILSSHKTAFERQLREAVLINQFSGPYLLNSKIEYSRTLLPKIETSLGRIVEKKEDPDVIREKSTIEKIKMLYKSENKRTAKSDIMMVVKRVKLDKNCSKVTGSEVTESSLAQLELSPSELD